MYKKTYAYVTPRDTTPRVRTGQRNNVFSNAV